MLSGETILDGKAVVDFVVVQDYLSHAGGQVRNRVGLPMSVVVVVADLHWCQKRQQGLTVCEKPLWSMCIHLKEF